MPAVCGYVQCDISRPVLSCPVLSCPVQRLQAPPLTHPLMRPSLEVKAEAGTGRANEVPLLYV